jgi:hypothetical protein
MNVSRWNVRGISLLVAFAVNLVFCRVNFGVTTLSVWVTAWTLDVDLDLWFSKYARHVFSNFWFWFSVRIVDLPLWG